MAFIGTNSEEEESMMPTTSTSPGAHATLPNYTQSPSGGGLVDGGSGGGAGAGAANKSTGGGGYVNLMQYLQANEDTGATTGKAAANVVQNSANDAAAANDAYSKAGSSQIVDASKPLGVDQNVLSNINKGTASVDQNILSKIATGKAGSIQTPGYKGPTTENANVSYGGPAGLGDFTGSALEAQSRAVGAQTPLQQNAANAQGGQTGVTALTRQAYDKPGYTQGENNLDAFLAGGTSQGRAALDQSRGLQQANQASYDSINKDLQSQMTGAQNTADATNRTYADAVRKAQATSAATTDAYKKAAATALIEKNKPIGKSNIAIPKAADGGPGGGSSIMAPGYLNIKPAENNTSIDPKKSALGSKIQAGNSTGVTDYGDATTGMGQNYAGNANLKSTAYEGGWNGALAHLPGMPDVFDPLHSYAFGGKIPSYKSILDKLGKK